MSSNQPSPLDWMTLAIAGWGAILSTLLVLAELRKSTRSLKVSALVPNRREDAIIIKAVCGRRPITIVRLGLRLSGGLTVDLPHPQLADPASHIHLTDGESHVSSVKVSSIVRQIRFAHRRVDPTRLPYPDYVFAEDAVGRKHKCRLPRSARPSDWWIVRVWKGLDDAEGITRILMERIHVQIVEDSASDDNNA